MTLLQRLPWRSQRIFQENNFFNFFSPFCLRSSSSCFPSLSSSFSCSCHNVFLPTDVRCLSSLFIFSSSFSSYCAPHNKNNEINTNNISSFLSFPYYVKQGKRMYSSYIPLVRNAYDHKADSVQIRGVNLQRRLISTEKETHVEGGGEGVNKDKVITSAAAAESSSNSNSTSTHTHVGGGVGSGGGGGNIHRTKVPNMGDSISEGTIMKWHKKIGDVVHEDEILCVIETDKVTVDIHADCTGKILGFATEEGGTVYVGGDLASLDVSEKTGKKETNKADAAENRKKNAEDKPAENKSVEKEKEKTNTQKSKKDGGGKRMYTYVPSICFGRHKKQKTTKSKNEEESEKVTKMTQNDKNAQNVIRYNDYSELESEYKPSKLSEEEIEVINSGVPMDENKYGRWINAIVWNQTAKKKEKK